jgi:hypothetical protein
MSAPSGRSVCKTLAQSPAKNTALSFQIAVVQNVFMPVAPMYTYLCTCVPALQGDPGRTLSLWDLDDRRLQASAFVMNAVKDVLKREEASSPPPTPFMLVSLRFADGPQPWPQDHVGWCAAVALWGQHTLLSRLHAAAVRKRITLNQQCGRLFVPIDGPLSPKP